MPYSRNENVEYHSNTGQWDCSMSNKPEPKLEDKLRGVLRLKQYSSAIRRSHDRDLHRSRQSDARGDHQPAG